MALFDNEIWVDVPFNDGYMVSSNGRVRSKDRYVVGKLGSIRRINGKILSKFLSSDGYEKVDISTRNMSVHRIVALAFIPNPENKKEVNHKDRNRANNAVENLEWVTLQENQLHSWESGRVGCMNGRTGFLHNRSNPIVQIENGERVAIYGSIKEAARELGVADSVIGQSIKRNSPITKRSHKLCGVKFEKI